MTNFSPGPYQSPQPMAAPSSTTAIISLVAGILGLTLFPVVGSVIAIILGYMARSEIARSNGTIGGAGLATAGLILGYIGVALFVLSICGVGLFLGLPACLLALGGLFYGTSNPQSLLMPLLLAV